MANCRGGRPARLWRLQNGGNQQADCRNGWGTDLTDKEWVPDTARRCFKTQSARQCVYGDRWVSTSSHVLDLCQCDTCHFFTRVHEDQRKEKKLGKQSQHRCRKCKTSTRITDRITACNEPVPIASMFVCIMVVSMTPHYEGGKGRHSDQDAVKIKTTLGKSPKCHRERLDENN